MPKIDIWEKRKVVYLRRLVLTALEENVPIQNKIYFEYMAKLAVKYDIKGSKGDGTDIDVNVNSMEICKAI